MKKPLTISLITLFIFCYLAMMAWSFTAFWMKPPLGTQINRSHWAVQAVLYLPELEGSGGKTFDYSRFRNHGTLNGAAWAAGRSGHALEFGGPGTDDNINVGQSSILTNIPDSPDGFSVVVSFNPNDVTDDMYLVSKRSAGDNGWFFRFDEAGGTDEGVAILIETDGALDVTVFSTLNLIQYGVWSHVVVTVPGSLTAAQIKFYLNGIDIGISSSSGSGAYEGDSGIDMEIGRLSVSGKDFSGKIEYVIIYPFVLAPAQVKSLFEQPFQAFASRSVARRFAPGVAAPDAVGDEPQMTQPLIFGSNQTMGSIMARLMKSLNPWADDYEERQVVNE